MHQVFGGGCGQADEACGGHQNGRLTVNGALELLVSERSWSEGLRYKYRCSLEFKLCVFHLFNCIEIYRKSFKHLHKTEQKVTMTIPDEVDIIVAGGKEHPHSR